MKRLRQKQKILKKMQQNYFQNKQNISCCHYISIKKTGDHTFNAFGKQTEAQSSTGWSKSLDGSISVPPDCALSVSVRNKPLVCFENALAKYKSNIM